MASTGFTLVGTGTGSGWSSPGNVTADDNAYAAETWIFAGELAGTDQQGTNCGFAIPADATIGGIEVRAAVYGSAAGAISDGVVRLVVGGTISGDDKGRGTGSAWATSEEQITWGGASDLWGLSLSPADVNAADFGASLRPYNAASGGRQAYVDAVWINVHYTESGGGTIHEVSISDGVAHGATVGTAVRFAVGVAGSVAHGASLTKLVSKGMGAAVAHSVALVKTVEKSVSAGVAHAATVTTGLRIPQSVTGAVAHGASLAAAFIQGIPPSARGLLRSSLRSVFRFPRFPG